MTRAEAILIASAYLGNQSSGAHLEFALDRAQQRLEDGVVFPDWLLTTNTIYTESGSTALNLGSVVVLSESPDHGLMVNDTTSGTSSFLQLTKVPYSVGKTVTDDATGVPTAYSRVDRSFYVWPIPDGSYAIILTAYTADALPSSLGDTSTNLWLTRAPEWLACQAAYDVGLMMGAPVERLNQLAQIIERERDRVLRQQAQARLAGASPITIGDALL